MVAHKNASSLGVLFDNASDNCCLIVYTAALKTYFSTVFIGAATINRMGTCVRRVITSDHDTGSIYTDG